MLTAMDHDGSGEAAGEDVTSLVVRCGRGDRAAFRTLYQKQSPRLYGLAMSLLRQPALAADAVHDAFLQVWQQSGRFDPSLGQAEAWLGGLLRYRAIDILRRRNRETYGHHRSQDVADEVPDALEMLSSRADDQALHRCLQILEERQRRAVELAFLGGLSHPELAARLGAPLGTVKSWVRRALISLKQCLEP